MTKMAPHLAEPTPRLPPTPQRASPKAPGDGLLPRAASKDRTPINAAQARSRLRDRTMRVFSSPRWRQLHARSRVEQKAASRAAPPPLPQQARCDRAASRRSRGPRPARASLAILYRPRRTKAWNAESPLRKSGGCLWANEQPRANAWRANDGSRRHEGRWTRKQRRVVRRCRVLGATRRRVGGGAVVAGAWAAVALVAAVALLRPRAQPGKREELFGGLEGFFAESASQRSPVRRSPSRSTSTARR